MWQSEDHAMLAYTASAPRTTTPAAPVRAPAAPAVSNAERAQQIGGTRPTNEGREGFWEELGALGSVVFDALPLPLAVQRALPLRGEPWVRDWFAEQRVGDLVALGGELLGTMLDVVFPVGTSIAFAASAEGDFEHLGLRSASRSCVGRTQRGWTLDLTGMAGAGVSAGLGGALMGARGTALCGALAVAEAGSEVELSVGWDVTLDAVIDEAAHALRDTLAQGAEVAVPGSLLRAVTHAASQAIPARFEARVLSKAGVDASMAAGTRAAGEATFASGAAIGVRDGASWMEVRFGGALGADALGLLVVELHEGGLDGLHAVAGELAQEVSLRVQAPSEPGGRWTYALTIGDDHDAETRSYAMARDVLAALQPLAAVGRRLSGTSRSVPAAPALCRVPDMDVRRDVEVEVEPRAAEGVLARAGAAGARWLPSMGPVIGVQGAHARTEVVVDAELAMAALRAGGSFAPPAEDNVLDAARAVIAYILGRTYVSSVRVDAAAVADDVKVEAEIVTEDVVAAGVGAAGDAVVVEAEAAVSEEIVVTQRHPVTDRSEIRELFHA